MRKGEWTGRNANPEASSPCWLLRATSKTAGTSIDVVAHNVCSKPSSEVEELSHLSAHDDKGPVNTIVLIQNEQIWLVHRDAVLAINPMATFTLVDEVGAVQI
jgi:hypothetical protein